MYVPQWKHVKSKIYLVHIEFAYHREKDCTYKFAQQKDQLFLVLYKKCRVKST